MSRIRSKDTKPEWIVRRLLHAEGYRYRLHGKGLPGRPDLVFKKRRKVIFVHGCFWHQHAREDCADGRRPKSNEGYWNPKLQRNIDRDAAHLCSLREEGWEVEVVWACETKRPDELRARLVRFLGPTSIETGTR
jgi:DNA mismatch endonuclease (patch repair protein)